MIASLFPLTQSEHFSETYLAHLFQSGILKSGAVGRDGVRPAAFAKIIDDETRLISRKVNNGTYLFTTFKERLILRGAFRSPRQISIPTVRDRLALRAACNALSAISPLSIPAPPHAHIKKIVSAIKLATEPMSFVRIDVRNFYPSIRHGDLKRSLLDIGVEPFLAQFILGAVGTPTGDKLNVSDKGVPQGLSISNILASIYMKGYDRAHVGTFCRYVDDILMVVPSHLASRTFKDEYRLLQSMGLEAHVPGVGAKSVIAPLGEGVEYLGYKICSNKVSIRQSSYKRMFSNLLRVITQYKYRANSDQFVAKLNLKITGCIVDGKRRGWLLFFSQTQDISQLKYLDKFVSLQLIRINIPSRQSDIKTFVKTYHEIRYNGCGGGYIPNFDTFDDHQKIEFILSVSGVNEKILRAMSPEELEHEFRKAVAREVRDLEKDVIDAFS